MDKLIPDPPASNAFIDANHTTLEKVFGVRDANYQALFQVPAGVKAEDALTQASHLLNCAYETTFELTDTQQDRPGLVGSILQLVSSAQALVDAVLEGAQGRRA
ncbi:MAG: DUF3077 domain-containing protein [Pseudomonas sp.]|uniref:DUF3077 domain-containing protein n=1 Tax=Pseudomonas abieticivorans TaxID=2931382 RepID=UPI0020C11042|nr:DUF3077 domain-containing protein [Pseudomonas sp. PIA16]MDE1163804.1 DUF3077 domain-containing protein [Pseudomonas sp.]